MNRKLSVKLEGFRCERPSEWMMDEYMQDAIKLEDRIAELEAAQRWIPVSERLPESGETVIVWDTNVEDFCRVIFSREMLSYPEITHWRPCFTSPTPQEQTL